jgi:hypothetical protein
MGTHGAFECLRAKIVKGKLFQRCDAPQRQNTQGQNCKKYTEKRGVECGDHSSISSIKLHVADRLWGVEQQLSGPAEK